jgi:hypothetical protein
MMVRVRDGGTMFTIGFGEVGLILATMYRYGSWSIVMGD